MFACISACALSACVAVPNYQQFPGGSQVDQPGVSFVLPAEKSWSAMLRSNYQVILGANERTNDETLIVSVYTYRIPVFSSSKEYLEFVKTGRAVAPETGKFEVVENHEELYAARTETCVKHESSSKDFNSSAIRRGGYTVYETFGMNCIHPNNATVGVFIELSRKAPPAVAASEFNVMGARLLQSVKFNGEFKIGATQHK
jgi:hypothetical protein